MKLPELCNGRLLHVVDGFPNTPLDGVVSIITLYDGNLKLMPHVLFVGGKKKMLPMFGCARAQTFRLFGPLYSRLSVPIYTASIPHPQSLRLLSNGFNNGAVGNPSLHITQTSRA